jgi:hypothetical protein
MLAHDHLAIGDRFIDEPHRPAGFEIVTLLFDGAIFDRGE